MHKNKVITVLRSLSSEEIRQLDKFVRSPIHNQHEDVIRLFQYLRKHLSNSERGLEKEKVFRHLYPKTPFDMQQLHYVSSYLMKVVESFLAWFEWKNSKSGYQLSLLRALSSHKLDSLFDKRFEETTKKIGNEKVGSLDLLYNYQMELERFNHDRVNPTKQGFRLQELSDSLDAFLVAEKLRCACILLSNQAVNNANYNTGILRDLLNYVENSELLKVPIIAAYYFASRTLENFEDDEAFRKLKLLLDSHRNSFKINELHDIYIFAINYCIRRFNSGSLVFMREVFDIYKFGMETDAFIQNGSMTPRTYSNVVMSGLRANEFEWVYHFIIKYKDYLPEKHRLGFFNYNLARLHYEQKNYKTAMPLLLQMEYEDVLLTCLGKILLAKMHFELGEIDSLASLLQSFKQYVQRKKMMGYHRENTINFIVFLGKLSHKNIQNWEKLKLDIQNTKVVAEKEWLLSQL